MTRIYHDDIILMRNGGNRQGVPYAENLMTGEIVFKQCTRCEQMKFLNEFNKAGKGFAGRHSHCRKCHSEHGKEYREKQPWLDDARRFFQAVNQL